MEDLEMMDEFEIGALVGERRTLSKLSGGCSAADAQCLRKIRESKKYLAKAPSWDEFCPKYLGMSRPSADRLIRHLEEFGPESFAVMQQLGISPREYKLLAPNMQGTSLLLEGETVALTPENGPKIHAALRGMRKSKPEPSNRLEALGGRCDEIVKEFRSLCRAVPGDEDRARIAERLNSVRLALTRIGLDFRL